MFLDQGGDIGRSIRDTVGRNPAAVVLVGVGLAWLFLSQGRDAAARGNNQRSGQNVGRNQLRSGHRASDAANDKSFSRNNRYLYTDGQMSKISRFKNGRARDTGPERSGMDSASNGMFGTFRDAANSVGDVVSEAAGSLSHAASDVKDENSGAGDDLATPLSEGKLVGEVIVDRTSDAATRVIGL